MLRQENLGKTYKPQRIGKGAGDRPFLLRFFGTHLADGALDGLWPAPDTRLVLLIYIFKRLRKPWRTFGPSRGDVVFLPDERSSIIHKDIPARWDSSLHTLPASHLFDWISLPIHTSILSLQNGGDDDSRVMWLLRLLSCLLTRWYLEELEYLKDHDVALLGPHLEVKTCDRFWLKSFVDVVISKMFLTFWGKNLWPFSV